MTAACAEGHGPPPPPAPPPPTRSVVLLSGQSNALYVAPYLALPLDSFAVVGQNGAGIGHWQDDDFDGSLWPAVKTVLTQRRVTAVVWWQGETDRRSDYLQHLRALVDRMRRTAGRPTLPFVIVRILDTPENASVRTAQEAFVAGDHHAVLVSTDGLRLGHSDHLTHRGYTIVAQRIRDALQGFDTPATERGHQLPTDRGSLFPSVGSYLPPAGAPNSRSGSSVRR